MRTLIDFIEEDPDGMEQVEDAETAKVVLDTLMREGMSASDLIRRCVHWEFAKELVTHVTDMFWDGSRGRQTTELLDALATMSVQWWEESGLESRWFLMQFRGWEVLDYLLKVHKEVVLSPAGPLYIEAGLRGLSFVDEYWQHKVRYFIVRTDWRRAWEEIEKAWKGLLNHGIVRADYRGMKEFIEECADPGNRSWKASYSLIGELVMELYHAMICSDVFKETLGAYRSCSSRQEVDVYRMSGKGGSGPGTYKGFVDRPAFGLALVFKDLSAYEDSDRRWSGLAHFTDTGAAVLLIAEHFACKKREKRRLKYVQALAAYKGCVAS